MIRASAWGFALLGLFLLLGYLVHDSQFFVDTVVSNALDGFWLTPAGGVVSIVTDALGPVLPIAMLFVLVIMAVRVRRDAWQVNVLLRGIVLLAACRAVSLFKTVFERDRPRDYVEFSYPSGHVVSVASVAFTSIVLCAWLVPRLLRRVTVIAVVAVVLSATFRVLLDVHWVTDVLGGTVGVTGVGLVVAAALRLLPVRERRVRE